MTGPVATHGREVFLVLFFALATIGLYYLPTGFEDRMDRGSIRARGVVLEVDNALVHRFGLINTGSQELSVRITSGPYADAVVPSPNHLLGKLDLDKLFQEGDRVLMVLTIRDGKIIHAQAMDHYRLHMQGWLVAGFVLLLVAFAGWTGLKALLSFAFAALMLWKVLVPGFLKGWDPILTSLGVVALMTAAILFLVAGLNRKGLTAFCGAMLGLGVTCALALLVAPEFRLHGAVKPFSETLLYTGYAHLDLTRIFLATIFLAASGAVMDLAMDVSASMQEVVEHNPKISGKELVLSGFRVGRVVVGTMTTTLLLAYSSSYISLLMVFMAQGIPMANMLNLNYIAAEFLNTILGSIGLVTVAPLTALAGGFVFRRNVEGKGGPGNVIKVGISATHDSGLPIQCRADPLLVWRRLQARMRIRSCCCRNDSRSPADTSFLRFREALERKYP
ncbi:YibE/F family protein [Desulfonatronum parangueonense]